MNPPRTSLDRHRVLDAAIAFADEHSVEALSMRRLAEELGVGAMTLYSYVANKDELLAAMADRVAEDIALPSPDGEPRDELARAAADAHRSLLDHDWAAGRWNDSPPGRARTAFMESILAALTDWGLDDDLVYRGYHAITMHIVGFAIQTISYRKPAGFESLRDAATGFLAQVDEAKLPHLVEHIRGHIHGVSGVERDEQDEFDFILGLILDGLANVQASR